MKVEIRYFLRMLKIYLRLILLKVLNRIRDGFLNIFMMEYLEL